MAPDDPNPLRLGIRANDYRELMYLVYEAHPCSETRCIEFRKVSICIVLFVSFSLLPFTHIIFNLHRYNIYYLVQVIEKI